MKKILLLIIIPVLIFLITMISVTEMLRNDVGFSVFVGIPAGLLIGTISFIIIFYRIK